MMKTRFNVGDSVVAVQDLCHGAIKKGDRGVVKEKYVPHWCTGVWSITVDFGKHCPVGLPFPPAGYVEVA